MIYALVGDWMYSTLMKRGNGKTFCMTVFLYLFGYLMNRKVITNYSTSFSESMGVNDIVDLFNNQQVQNLCVGIDEMQNIFDSYHSYKKNSMEHSLLMMVLQTRKDSVNLYYTTQRYMNVHLRIRQQTDYIYEPQVMHFDGTPCYYEKINNCPVDNDSHNFIAHQIQPYNEYGYFMFPFKQFKGIYNTEQKILR